MSGDNSQIRISEQGAVEKLRKLASDDLRSMGAEMSWLIHQEFTRREKLIQVPAERHIQQPEAK